MNINTIAVEDQREYAADATLPAVLLAALADSYDEATRKALALNPSIDAATAMSLSRSLDQDTLEVLARKPFTAPALLSVLADSDDYDIQVSLATNRAIATDTVAALAFSTHWKVRRVVAGRSDLPVAIADVLLADVRPEVAMKAANNAYVAQARLDADRELVTA